MEKDPCIAGKRPSGTGASKKRKTACRRGRRTGRCSSCHTARRDPERTSPADIPSTVSSCREDRRQAPFRETLPTSHIPRKAVSFRPFLFRKGSRCCPTFHFVTAGIPGKKKGKPPRSMPAPGSPYRLQGA